MCKDLSGLISEADGLEELASKLTSIQLIEALIEMVYDIDAGRRIADLEGEYSQALQLGKENVMSAFIRRIKHLAGTTNCANTLQS